MMLVGAMIFLVFILFTIFAGEKYMMVLLFIALAYPYRIWISIGPLNSFSVVDVFLALTWTVLIVRRFLYYALPLEHRSYRINFRLSGIDAVIWSYVGYSLLSALWAENKALALRGLVPILENVAFYYLIVTYCSDRKRTDQVVRWFLWLGIAALTLSLLFYFGGMDFLYIRGLDVADDTLNTTIQTRLGSPAWGASNYFASIFLLFLPVYFSLAMTSAKQKDRVLYGLVTAAGLIAFFFTFSRGGYVSLIVGAAMGLFLVGRQRIPSVRAILTIATLTVLTGLFMWFAVSNFPDFQEVILQIPNRVLVLDDENTLSRLYFFQAAYASILSNPLGLGTGNFSVLPQLGGMNVHNIYLQMALEIGWFGFLIFVLMLGLLFLENWGLLRRLKNTLHEPLAIGFVVSFIAILVNIAGQASFEGVIFGWVFWMTQGLVRALSMAYADYPRQTSPESSRSSTPHPSRQPLQGNELAS
jgi:O-antigen ligase